MLPAAGAIAVIAPFSTVLVRAIGTKLTVAAGLLIIAGGLWQVSASSTTTTYAGILPGLILLGVGAGLTIPSATDSVIGSLPSGHTGVGSATNGAFMQIGGALGVAVMGSLLNTRYQDKMASTLAAYHEQPRTQAPRSRDAIPWRTGLSVEGSCVTKVTAISFRQFHSCSSQASRPGRSS